MSKAERTKAFIIEKTAPLFNARGFAGTSLLDITTVTGLSKGSIYSNFRNKDGVALAVFDYNWKKLVSLIAEMQMKEVTVIGKLLVYADVYEHLLRDPALSAGCPILNTATESDDTHPLLRRKAARAMGSWRAGLTGLLDRGIQSGELKKTTDAQRTAFTIIAMIEGSIMISKLSGKSSDRQNTRQSLETYINSLHRI